MYTYLEYVYTYSKQLFDFRKTILFQILYGVDSLESRKL